MTQTKQIVRVSENFSFSDVVKAYKVAKDDLVFVDVNTVLSGPHLELLTDYPRSVSAALVGKVEEGSDVLVRRDTVVSGSSETHVATVTNRLFAGAIRLSQIQRDEILPVLEDAAARNAKGHPLNLLLIALARGAVQLDAVEIKSAPFARSTSQEVLEQAKKELSKVSDERIRLKLANRANDGFYSVYVLRRFSKILTFLAVRIKATPNQVTVASFAIGLFSAYLFSRADFWSMLLGAILLQVSLVVDCVDGELARYTRKFSKLGAWLDAITDRVKEYAVFLGLAIGAISVQGQNLWVLAMAMMALQTFRHLSDYNFSQVVKARTKSEVREKVDFLAPSDGIVANDKQPRGRLRYWLGKIVLLPIGERWLVISATAALGGAWLTFTVLPILSLISLAFVFRVRIRRSLEMPLERIKSLVITTQLDLPPAKQSFTKRFDWMEPSLLRAIELGMIIGLGIVTESLGVALFVLLFSVVFHHYDNLYRAMQVERKPVWLTALSLSIWGRLAISSVAMISGFGLEVVAGYFFVVMVLVSSIQWVLSHQQ